MSNEYLRKSVGDRRTGANLIGIHVDTNNMNNIAPDYAEAFNRIEAFAKEMDNVKISNEQTRIGLELAKQRLDFEETYLSDPTVYNDEDRFNEAIKLSETDLRKKGEKLIADSMYLDKTLKEQMVKSFNLQYSKMIFDARGKRNQVYIKQETDKNRMNIEMAKQLASVDPDNTEMYLNNIRNSYGALTRAGIYTKQDVDINFAKDIIDVEMGQLEMRAENSIINNSDLTIEQKQEQLKAFYNSLTDEKINNISEGIVKNEQMDENIKEYTKAGLKYRYELMKGKLNEKMLKMETQYLKAKKEESEKTTKAYNEKNFYDYAKSKNKSLTWDELLNTEIIASKTGNKENSYVYQLTGKTIFSINESGEYIKNLMPKETMDIIKTDIKNMMANGENRYSATIKALTPILTACDDDTAQAVINSLASESGEYRLKEYDYILKGIKNPKDTDFINAVKINNLIEIGGKVSASQMSVLKNVPIINNLTQKIIVASGGNIDYDTALSTVISLGLGINVRDKIVETAVIPKDFSEQADYIMHVFMDKNLSVVKTLNEEFGDNNMIETIAQMKSNKGILLPVNLRKGDR